MKPTLEKAWGYQGDHMNLPVRDLAAALPFYERVFGFRLLSRSETPHKSDVGLIPGRVDFSAIWNTVSWSQTLPRRMQLRQSDSEDRK